MSSAPIFICPCCSAVSHHPTDLEQGYCARCNWWTGDAELGRDHLAGLCEMRLNPEFAAFAAEFRDHVFPPGMTEAEKNLWRDLRTS